MKRMTLPAAMIALLVTIGSVRADVKLSRIFGNHMVIQQEQPIRVFGWADPGEKVTVELAGKTASATTAENGKFRVDLPAMRDYARKVCDAAQAWVGTLTPEDLERTIETPVGKLNLGQVLETFVVWHVSAHTGEISALKGCQGAKGYPF